MKNITPLTNERCFLLTEAEIEKIANDAALRSFEIFSSYQLVGSTQAAKALGVSFNTFKRYVTRPDFPAPYEGGKWKLGDLKRFAGFQKK